MTLLSGCALVAFTEPDAQAVRSTNTTSSSYRVVNRGHTGQIRETQEQRKLRSLLRRLESPRAVVRTHSVFWIGEMGASGRPAESKLRELLSHDQSPWVRRGCVKALVKILGPEATPLLRQALNDRDTWVVHSARNALR